MTQPAPGPFGPQGGQQAHDDAALADLKKQAQQAADSGGASGLAAFGKGLSSNANTQPQYGGYAGGANDAANYAAGIGQGYANRQAPAIDNTYTDQMRAQRYGDYSQQGQALGLLGAAARGQGPTAADAQLGRGISASINAGQAAANSARGGGSNLAAAQHGASMQAAQTADAGAQQAAALRAQEMQAAQGAYMQGSLGMGQQNLAAQGQEFGQGLSAAQLAQQQEQLNQSGQLGALGLAYGAEGDQSNAASSAYSAQTAAAAAKYASDQQMAGNVMSGVAGLTTGGASAIATMAKKP